jgi:hypothetical protein
MTLQLPLTGAEPVDELVEAYSLTRSWLGAHGLICVQCGEVYWGSLASLAQARGMDSARFAEVLAELNAALAASAG